MQLIEVIGLAAGICTSASSIPQVVTTIRKKRAADISPFMFMVLLTGNALWVYYGISKADLPIYVTNIISVILDIVMLVLKFKYRNN